eukprot:384496-Prorocentrum_minimum.AAC.1
MSAGRTSSRVTSRMQQRQVHIVTKQPDETEQRFEERKAQFVGARARCLSSAAEREAARKKQKIEANLNMATGGVLRRKAFTAVR